MQLQFSFSGAMTEQSVAYLQNLMGTLTLADVEKYRLSRHGLTWVCVCDVKNLVPNWEEKINQALVGEHSQISFEKIGGVTIENGAFLTLAKVREYCEKSVTVFPTSKKYATTSAEQSFSPPPSPGRR